MHVLRARVRNGRLVLDEPTSLPEGTEVELVAASELGEGDELGDDDRVRLHAAIDAGLAARERGAPAEVVLAKLHRSQ